MDLRVGLVSESKIGSWGWWVGGAIHPNWARGPLTPLGLGLVPTRFGRLTGLRASRGLRMLRCLTRLPRNLPPPKAMASVYGSENRDN